MKKFFEKHDLFKIVCLAIFVTVILTWIIAVPNLSGGTGSEPTLVRLGLVDLISSIVYGLSFFLQQILLIVFVGIFYGIISNVTGYKLLVKKIASIFKGKEKIFVILSSLIIALITSMITQVFVMIVFVPFIINIAKELKLDKITTMMCTFGSMLIGVLGATFGTEGMNYFISYLGSEDVTMKTLLNIRFGIFAIAILLYNFFMMLHMKKVSKNEEEVEDLFEVKDSEKGKVWPMAVLFGILFIFWFLAYINWSGIFPEIKVFDDFFKWLTGLKVGDYPIIAYIIGRETLDPVKYQNFVFGNWTLYLIILVMMVILLLVKIMYRVKINDLLDNASSGIKKMIKPCVIVLLIYTIFVYIYWSPFTYTVINWFIGSSFNPFLTALAGFISGLFHIDFGYTSYLLSDTLLNMGTSIDIGFIIFVTMNGFVNIIAPTSVVLFLGLSYLNISYKDWLKNIWKFALIMLVVLMVIYSLLTYL